MNEIQMEGSENRAGVTDGPWWGTRPLEEGRCGRLQLEEFRLWLLNRAREWHIAWDRATRSDGGRATWSEEGADAFPEDPEWSERYMMRRRGREVNLTPLLPDRPVVASPRMPVYLLPQEETTLYIGVPLWLSVSVNEPPRLLRELSMHRPSDTWFGANTRSGELCYATRTRARIDAERLPHTATHAISPVRVSNRATTPLRIERIKLPAPYLELYAAEDGLLWTQGLTLGRETDGDLATIEVRPGPAREHGARELVQGPRTPLESTIMTRAFGSFASILHGVESA